MYQLRVVRYRWRYCVEQSVRLPPYLSSKWRGAFGRALKATVCLMPPHTPCLTCPLRQTCLYPLFFEDNLVPELARYTAPPRPFIVECGAPPDRAAVGETLELDMVLIGAVNDYLMALIPAARRAGQYGLDVGRERVLLRLLEVLRQDGIDQWTPLAPSDGALPRQVAPIPIPAPPQRVRIEWVTPLRLKHRGRLVTPETFSLAYFIERLLARSRLLEQFYGEGEADTTLTVVHDLPGERRRELRWREISHWSARQRALMKLGGVVGFMEINNGERLTLVWPALWLGQWLHVGNNTSFGLGEYRLVPLD